jgi:hypothetical protein
MSEALTTYDEQTGKWVTFTAGDYISAIKRIAELQAELARHEWVSVEDTVANLLCYLVDRYENQPLSEIKLQEIGTDFLRNKHYNKPAPAKPEKEVISGNIMICGGCEDEIDINYEGITCHGCGIELCMNCQSSGNCPECDYDLNEERESDSGEKVCEWKKTGDSYLTTCNWSHGWDSDQNYFEFKFCAYCGLEIREKK